MCGTKLNDELDQMGAARSTVDPCLDEWHHPAHGRLFILVCVDDLIAAGESFAGMEVIKSGVSAMFEVRDMGSVKEFIGTKVMRDEGARSAR